jgi:hypothetical protein
MNLEIVHRPPALTAPSISPQHLFMQFSISLLIESEPRAFGADGVHEAVRALSRNSCLLGWGRESNSRSKEVIRTSELPASRLARQGIHKTITLVFMSPSKHQAPGFQSLRVVYPKQPDKRRARWGAYDALAARSSNRIPSTCCR